MREHGLVVLSRGGSKGQEMVDKSDILTEHRVRKSEKGLNFLLKFRKPAATTEKVRMKVRILMQISRQ